MSENRLRDALLRREFVCSAELVLGRDHAAHEAEAFVRDAAGAAASPVGIVSVTDLPGGHPALPPEAFMRFILEHGLTPIAHLTGKDANRSLLEGRLHTLAGLGVENVLALTGDAQKDGYAGGAKPVHDLDSVLILRLVEALRAGLTYRVGAREARTAPFDFFPGAVVNPYKPSEPAQMMQLYKLELKVAAGARFIITQMGFNLRKLVELKQYMAREGLGHVPVLANVYVPTATIGRLALSGELAGCMVPATLVQRLAAEKKPERLERAALMLAAVRELGFAGAHIGGFRLTHADFVAILERSAAIGSGWRERMDELVWETAGEFYLLPPGDDGLSDATGEYQLAGERRPPALKQRVSRAAHRWIISRESPVGRFFSGRLQAAAGAAGAPGAAAGAGARSERWRHGFWYHLLEPSSLYRKSVLGCMGCGDCVQDHLNYVGCPMRMCYKQLRNGPCGGSRPDGSCEARPDQPCFWHLVYDGARSLGDDPRRFARTLIPPRNWRLDRTNALANHFAALDNAALREQVVAAAGQERETC